MTATAQANSTLQIDHFADDVREIIVKAQALADERHHKEIQPLHLLACAMKNSAVLKTFKMMSFSEQDVIKVIETGLSDMATNLKGEDAYFCLSLEKFFTNLEKDSSISDKVYIDKFFKALTAKTYKQNYVIFQQLSINLEDFYTQLETIRKAGFSQMTNTQLLKWKN